MKDVIFTSYCFDNPEAGGDYKAQQDRMQESILKIYPEANLHFKYENKAIGKPKFQQSLYGFKVDLVKECLAKGFKKIIFFDAAITLNTEVDYWFDIIKDYGILCPVDRQKLNTVSSNNVLKYLNLTREQVSEWNLCGGSVYVFDFDNPKCIEIWDIWKDLEEKGLFGQQGDISNGKLEGHRMDETCMGLAMGLTGNAPQGYDIVKYGYINASTKELTTYGDEYTPIVIKRHFK
jgi:hypothetical protein